MVPRLPELQAIQNGVQFIQDVCWGLRLTIQIFGILEELVCCLCCAPIEPPKHCHWHLFLLPIPLQEQAGQPEWVPDTLAARCMTENCSTMFGMFERRCWSQGHGWVVVLGQAL